MKKTLALLLALLLAFALAVPAMAAEDGSVTVDNALVGETYHLYKVFDLTYSGGDESTTGTEGGDTLRDGVSYTYTGSGDFLTGLQAEGSPFSVANTATAGTYQISKKDAATAETISDFLQSNVANLTEVTTATKTGLDDDNKATATSISWSNLGYGYYYVTSSLGSAVTIDSTLKAVTVKDKNSVPTQDKKQSLASDGSFVDTVLDVAIGDTVYYQVTITDGKSTDKDIVLTDVMGAGLTFNQSSIQVKKGETVLAENTEYNVTSKSDTGFTLTLLASYVSTLVESNTVVVSYNATVDSDIVPDTQDNDANKNTSTLTYSAQTSAADAVYVATYDFTVKKTDGTSFVSGSGFKLYDAETNGNQIKVNSSATTPYYLDATNDGATEIVPASDSGATVKGLKPGTYYLEETTVPAGYNGLSSRQAFTIASGASTPVEVVVVNQAGKELPSTGGSGTQVFYIVGGVLALGAGLVLVTRRRVRNTDR